MKQKKKGLSAWDRHQQRQRKMTFAFWLVVTFIFLILLGLFIWSEYT
jgi:heme/copper-type cytochrome/quinol oxidase subunit 2